jgi:hypothetical protein
MQPLRKFSAYYGTLSVQYCIHESPPHVLSWSRPIRSIQPQPTSPRSISYYPPFLLTYQTTSVYSLSKQWSVNATILSLLLLCHCHSKFRSHDHHQVAYSRMWHSNNNSWLHIQLTLRRCSFINIGDQILHPYKTTGKIIVLYILIFTLLDSRW